MNNLDGINKENIEHQTFKEKKISKDHKIPRILKDQTINTPNASNKKLKNTTHENAKKNEFSLIKDFVKLITSNLNPDLYQKEIELLGKIGIEKRIFEYVDLIQVKDSLYHLRDAVLNVLKDISPDDLYKIDSLVVDVKLPVFFDDIFELAELLQSEPHLKIVRGLLKHGEIYMALQMIDKLPNENKKNALSKIAETIDLNQGFDFDKIPEKIKFDLLTDILKLVSKQDHDQILKITSAILNSFASFKLKRAKQFYSALSKLETDLLQKIIDTLPSQKREYFIENLFTYLITHEKDEKARELAKKSDLESILNHVITSID